MELDPALAPLLPTNRPGRPALPGGARRIGASLPSANHKALVALAARDGRPLSAYVRDVLVSHVEALTGSDDDLVDEDPDQRTIEISAPVVDEETRRHIADLMDKLIMEGN